MLSSIACFLFLQLAVAQKVTFLPERGFYSKPFLLALSAKSGLSINYLVYNDVMRAGPLMNATLSRTDGTPYTKPISIEKSTVIFAVAFDDRQIGGVVYHSYLFAADLLTDPAVYQPYRQLYGDDNITAGILALPSLSFSSQFDYPKEHNDLVIVPGYKFTENKRRCQLEWLDPSHPKDNFAIEFQNATFDIFGTSSRYYIKKNLKIVFDSAIEFPFFKDFEFGVKSTHKFKHINLRAFSQDGPFGWAFLPLFMKAIFQEWTQLDSGGLGTHGRYSHVFFNGKYKGLYHLREKLHTESYHRHYFGDDSDQYEAIGGDAFALGGRVPPEVIASFTTYHYMQANQNWETLNKFINWDNYFTFVSVVYYTITTSDDLSPIHNVQFGGHKLAKTWYGKHAGWLFQTTGPDLSLMITDVDTPWVAANKWTAQSDITGCCFDYFLSLWQERHPDFVMLFHDHVFRTIVKPGGAFTYSAVKERFERILSSFQLNMTLRPELLLWGHSDVAFPYSYGKLTFTLAEWQKNVDAVMTRFIPTRANALFNQYRNRGWANPYGQVYFSTLNDSDGNVNVTMKISGFDYAGDDLPSIYYTTNNEDPRLPYAQGAVMNPKGFRVSAPFTLSLNVTTKIRARAASAKTGWGALNEEMFVAGSTKVCQMCEKIIFTEINYNPEKGRYSHFVEVKNIATVPVVLTGATIKGLGKYTFPPLTLAPQQFWVVAFYIDDFPKVYGKIANDYHLVYIPSTGDTYTLEDANGNTVHAVAFESSLPWSEAADGESYSLVARPQDYQTIAKNSAEHKKNRDWRYWRASNKPHGSPWADDGPFDTDNVSLRFKYISFNENLVELLNPTAQAVDLSKWSLLAKLDNDYKREELKDGTKIPAGGSLVVRLKMVLHYATHLVLFAYNPGTKTYHGEYIEYNRVGREIALPHRS